MADLVLRRRALASLCFSTAFLAACGGGGGAAAPAPAPAPAAAPVAPPALTPQLSRTQLKAVAASIYDDVLRSSRVASASTAAYQNMGQLFALGTQSFQCSTGEAGTLALLVTDHGAASQLDGGDTVSLTYEDCDLSSIGINATMAGVQSLALDSATGTPSAGTTWAAQLTISWTALASTPNNSIIGYRYDGSVTVSMSASAAGTSVLTADLSGLTQTDYMTAQIAGLPANTPLSSLAYQDFTLLYSTDLGGSSASMHGETVYRALGDPTSSPVTTTYTTNVAFLTTPSGVPVRGDLRAVASALRPLTLNGQSYAYLNLPASTTFRWVVLDASTVRLDTDENSDGVNESSMTFTFAEIAG